MTLCCHHMQHLMTGAYSNNIYFIETAHCVMAAIHNLTRHCLGSKQELSWNTLMIVAKH